MTHFEVYRSAYMISTDPEKLQLEVVYRYLAEDSYWAKGRPLPVIERAVAHSLGYDYLPADQAIAPQG